VLSLLSTPSGALSGNYCGGASGIGQHQAAKRGCKVCGPWQGVIGLQHVAVEAQTVARSGHGVLWVKLW